MKDNTISAIEVDTYVRLAFKDAFLGTNIEPENIIIGRFKQDNGKTGYYINYTLWDYNHTERNFMPIDGKTFFDLIKKGLELKGYDVNFIKEFIRDDNYYYKLQYSVLNLTRRIK